MEKTNTIAAMKVENQNRKQSKFGNWWKTKAMPWLKFNVFSKIRLPSLRTILILAILVYMANNGAFKDMPNTQWMLNSAVRLIEWIFGVLRRVIELFVNTIDFIGFPDFIINFMKTIFAL